MYHCTTKRGQPPKSTHTNPRRLSFCLSSSHSQLARRRRACTDGKVPGLLKSVSMTTLLTAEALEPIDPVREDAAEGYNMDGQCIQQFFEKAFASESDFGFACPPRDSHSIRQSVSSTSPKKRRAIHQSFKSMWQPVGRTFARCCTWEAASSVDSSSRRMYFSPCGFFKRLVCCAPSCSSDDGKTSAFRVMA